ncbi:MAG: nuclear transport factor 2 family protein [Gemmatimonadota bacterium]
MKQRSILLVLGLVITGLAAAPLRAQSADESAVLDVVTRFFDGMRAADSAAMRATLMPSVILHSASIRDSAPVLELAAMEEFLVAVGTPRPEVWDERLTNSVVRIDGPLAMVWTDYAFYIGERFSHCGVDVFQLFRAADGWKIFAIADTRRREGCAPPSAE